MRFRCSRCQTVTEVTVLSNITDSFLASCSGCGLRHSLTLRRPRPSSAEQADQWAEDLARTYGFDVAVAKSVIEGILTLGEAVEMFGKGPGASPEVRLGPAPRPDAEPARTKPGPTAAPPVLPTGEPQAPPRAPSLPSQEPAITCGTAVSAKPTPTAPPSTLGPPPSTAGPPPSTPLTPSPSTTPVPRILSAAVSEVEFDPGFAQAVQDGCLTVQQAVERGNRQAAAARLADRHGLSIEMAVNVVDNRLTVRQALLHKAEIERREAVRPARLANATISRGVRVFALLSLAALSFAVFALRAKDRGGDESRATRSASRALPAVATSPAPSPSRSSASPAASDAGFALVQTDTLGQIVRVEGPSARSVLAAYCAAGGAEKRQPLEVVEALPPSASTRFGVFHVLSTSGTPRRAIRIRRESSGRWAAGNGRGPITSAPAPESRAPAEPLEASGETAVAAAPEAPRR